MPYPQPLMSAVYAKSSSSSTCTSTLCVCVCMRVYVCVGSEYATHWPIKPTRPMLTSSASSRVAAGMPSTSPLLVSCSWLEVKNVYSECVTFTQGSTHLHNAFFIRFIVSLTPVSMLILVLCIMHISCYAKINGLKREFLNISIRSTNIVRTLPTFRQF